jgi:fibronectin-binding autotransporter adhesin
MKTIRIVLTTSIWLLIIHLANAGSATWKPSPASGNWNTPSNWIPATVPNGPSDTATFASSNTTALSFSASVEVNGIVYGLGASAFTTSVLPSQVLTLSGVGIANNSGIVQNFSLGTNPTEIDFTNSATAGTLTAFTTAGGVSTLTGGGEVIFSDTSTAGNAIFVNNPGTQSLALGGLVTFSGSSTAGAAVFTNNGGTVSDSSGGSVVFLDSSNAGNATITNNGRGNTSALAGGTAVFDFTSSASTATITNMPNGDDIITGTTFSGAATAENSVITNEGATVSGQIGGNMKFEGSSSAGNSTIICNGGTVTGAGGGLVLFSESSMTANATLIANGGVNGGDGGEIQLVQRPPHHAGRPRVQLFGNGALETSLSQVTIGSLEGDGILDIGSGGLAVGSNNLNTTFSGVIQGDGGFSKTGHGTLTLSSVNTYTGGTTVSGGTLIIQGATPTGITIFAGTFGGAATVPSYLIVQATTQTPAVLAPAAGDRRQTTLTAQGQLWFFSEGSSYTYTFRAKGSRARTDLVVANGVRIDAGTINLQGTVGGTLQNGLTLTLISNTSANPISGTFSNLADGAIVTIGGNNFQASYEGGDGNDLTLTVVP